MCCTLKSKELMVVVNHGELLVWGQCDEHVFDIAFVMLKTAIEMSKVKIQ